VSQELAYRRKASLRPHGQTIQFKRHQKTTTNPQKQTEAETSHGKLRREQDHSKITLKTERNFFEFLL